MNESRYERVYGMRTKYERRLFVHYYFILFSFERHIAIPHHLSTHRYGYDVTATVIVPFDLLTPNRKQWESEYELALFYSESHTRPNRWQFQHKNCDLNAKSSQSRQGIRVRSVAFLCWISKLMRWLNCENSVCVCVCGVFTSFQSLQSIAITSPLP